MPCQGERQTEREGRRIVHEEQDREWPSHSSL